MQEVAFELSELLALLLIASVVAVAVKYVRLPYTIALVLVGLLVGSLRVLPEIPLSEEVIFYLVLPPLLFEGALNMDLSHLRRSLKPIAMLAVAGVVVSVAIVGYLLHLLLTIPLPLALLFGAMITPTDPVSVLATFKSLGVPKRLATIVEGESIFNDGTGVVMFAILLEMLRSGEFSPLQGAAKFLFVCAGGAVVGLLLGYVAYRLLACIDDHLIEVTITLILAFSSFILAEHFHASGVIAVVASGLIIGNYGRLFSMSPSTRLALITFWDFAVFIVNSLIFLIIGIDIHPEKLLAYSKEVAVAIAAVLAARALAVYPLLGLLNLRLRSRIPLLWQHIIFWGGLHGTIPVALALGLERDFPMRELLASMTFGVVLFSLVLQGLSLELILRGSPLVRKHELRLAYEEKLARAIANKAARREIERMLEEGEVSRKVGEEVISALEGEAERLAREIAQLVEKDLGIQKEERFTALRRSLEAQKSAVREAVVRGLISEEVARRVVEDIDAELDLLYQER